MTSTTVNIFAYGSNMCLQRMESRVSTARPIEIGFVRQRRLVFHKRSHDGSAKADAELIRSESAHVWGVVYQIERDQKAILDQFEFLGTGYDEELVDVVLATGSLQAWIYVAREHAIDRSLLPYRWYHEYVIQGAYQHGLPASYIEYLKSFASEVDPDPVREQRHRQIVAAPANRSLDGGSPGIS